MPIENPSAHQHKEPSGRSALIGKKRGKPRKTGSDDHLPLIRLEAGKIEAAVDQAEEALIRSGRGLFQRYGLIVSIGQESAPAVGGRRVVVQRILERGDHALREDLSSVARFERFDGRTKAFVRIDPPMEIVKTLKERTGRLRFPVLTGIINAPTMRADGTLLTAPGYDVKTGLLFDPSGVEFPKVKERPTRRDAEAALAMLSSLIATFPFVEEKHRSVALSAILTVCVRQSLRNAPLHAFTSPVAGSGKSKLVDLANAIAYGHEAAVIALGPNDTELEKRLSAALLAGDRSISLDNCMRPLGGDFLCAMMTQARVKPRILGKTQIVELLANTFVTATGNNLTLFGDMTRRAILGRLDPKVERPETRTFEEEPVGVAKSRRPEFVAASLTVLRAFLVAGRPNLASALGSFDDWSDLVRSALIWLRCADPAETMDELRRSDPRLDDLRCVMAHWRAHVGVKRVTAAQVIKVATEKKDEDFARPEFYAALMAVADQGGDLSARRLGIWLKENQDRVVDGMVFQYLAPLQGTSTWRLQC